MGKHAPDPQDTLSFWFSIVQRVATALPKDILII